jgi:hypothetical protein
MFVRIVSEEGRGGNLSVNQNAARQTARAILLATRRKSAIQPTAGSGDHPVLWRSVSQTPTTSNKSVESPVLEGRKWGIDTSNKYSNDNEVRFKRIVIAKTATINMMNHNIH